MRHALLLIIISAVLASCNGNLFNSNVDCSECYYIEPDSADLVVELTIDERFRYVPLVVYQGEVEDNRIEYTDTAYASPYYLWVRVGQKYSVKAEYKKSHATLFVVDGTKIKTNHVQDECDEECYTIEKEALDVQIKDEFRDF
jgi:hypothetical protein